MSGSDTEYGFTLKSGERRVDKRKRMPTRIPIEVQPVFAKGGKECDNQQVVLARKCPREKVTPQIPANILLDQQVNGFILDISRQGLKVSSAVLLEKDKIIGVFFQLPAPTKGLTLICQVKWSKEYGYGMAHSAGLQILQTSDDQTYLTFVNNLLPATTG